MYLQTLDEPTFKFVSKHTVNACLCLNKTEVRRCEHGSLINSDVPQKVRGQLNYGQISKTLSAQWSSISLNTS